MIFSGLFSNQILSYTGEEMIRNNDIQFWQLSCRYLEFDGEVFGEVSTLLKIEKFRGPKRISTLEALPIECHPRKMIIKSDLVSCGRKFVSLMGVHHQYCKGSAFTKDQRGDLVKVVVDGRIMIDTVFFRKMQSNYIRPWVVVEDDTMSESDHIGIYFRSVPSSDQFKQTSPSPATLKEYHLICFPVVPGFSFSEDFWVCYMCIRLSGGAKYYGRRFCGRGHLRNRMVFGSIRIPVNAGREQNGHHGFVLSESLWRGT